MYTLNKTKATVYYQYQGSEKILGPFYGRRPKSLDGFVTYNRTIKYEKQGMCKAPNNLTEFIESIYDTNVWWYYSGDKKRSEFPCLACSGMGSFTHYGHPNDLHEFSIKCPFCRGSGESTSEQLLKDFEDYKSMCEDLKESAAIHKVCIQEAVSKISDDDYELLKEYFLNKYSCEGY